VAFKRARERHKDVGALRLSAAQPRGCPAWNGWKGSRDIPLGGREEEEEAV
jgi:hypothetical protein